jgi:hypothetical protein
MKLDRFKKFKDVCGFCVLGLIATQSQSHTIKSIIAKGPIAMSLGGCNNVSESTMDNENTKTKDASKKKFKR